MSHEVWTQGNDEDELRAVCSCGWRGPWRDLIRAAYEDQADHLMPPAEDGPPS